ncbi:DUF4190 domain-containing protein [Kitasatospora sp. NPDC004289]
MSSIPDPHGAVADRAADSPVAGAPEPEPAGSERGATAALVLGVLGFTGIGALAGIGVGLAALRPQGGRPRRRRGRAVTGVVLSVAWLVALALVVPGLLDRPAPKVAGKAPEEKTLLVELTTGQCLVEVVAVGRLEDALATVPCDRPHHAEVTAVASLPGRELPDDAVLGRKCAGVRGDYAPDALRLPEDAGSRMIIIDDHMKVVCLIETEQARSGSLRQDAGLLSTKQMAYLAATRDLEVLLTTWPDKAVADAVEEHREYARQVADAVTGTRAAIDGRDWGSSKKPLVDKYRLELDELAALARTVRTDQNTATVERAVSDLRDLAFGRANRDLRMEIGLSG